MNTIAIEEIPSTSDIIPKFSELKDTPKTTTDAFWVIGVACLPFCIWTLKGAISTRWERGKAKDAAELEEQKIELAQRDSLIKHLQEQNNRLINEIFILRRTMDYSGDFSNPVSKIQK